MKSTLTCSQTCPTKSDHFIIIGEGPRKPLIAGKILRYTYINLLDFEDDILNIMSMMDVFVTMSRHERMPNTLAENLIFENRIVASNIDEHVLLLGERYKYYAGCDTCAADLAKLKAARSGDDDDLFS